MTEPESEWVANLENKKKLTIDDAKFIFEQAEKFLLDVIEAHKTIIDRTNTLLALIITILTALIGFNVNKLEGGYGNDVFSNSIWFLIVYLLIGGIYLVTNIKPINYMASGSQPRTIFTDRFFRESIPKNDRVIYMYSSEIERYQTRIKENMKINNAKWKIYKNGIWILTGIPIVFLLTYFFIVILAKIS